MKDNQINILLFVLQGVGATLVGLFLAAYLAGLFLVPQTTVLHSIPEIRLALAILGGIFMVLCLVALIVAALTRK